MLVDHGDINHAMCLLDDSNLVQDFCRCGSFKRNDDLAVGIGAVDARFRQLDNGCAELFGMRGHRVHDQADDVQFFAHWLAMAGW